MSKEKREEEEKATQPVGLSEEDKKFADDVKKKYNSGVDFKRKHQFYEVWPEYDRFWNAEQWPQEDRNTKDYPRPVTNHFAAIIEQKISGITYEPPSIYFDPVDTQVLPPVSVDPLTMKGEEVPEEKEISDIDAAEALSHVASHQWDRLGMDDLVDEVSRSSGLLGTGVFYMPWNNDIIGGGPESKYIGDIEGMEIDPADFYPGDPSNRDIQSQPWIIVAERRPRSEVKAFYRKFAEDVVDTLKEDKPTTHNIMYDQQRMEQDETEYVDLLHYWWKEKAKDEEGNIKVTPQLNYAVVCQDVILRYAEEFYRHGLYPFAAFQWYPKRKSFFGKPESVDIINNQKEENRLAGVALLSTYKAGVPNVRYKPGFVDKKDIPAGPGGGQIPDNSPPGGIGIDYMQPPTPASHIPQLRVANVDGMKDTSGVHEAWSGKAPGARLNASAIMALQEAAGVRIRGIQRRLFRALREVGKIWLAHWKEFMAEERMFRILKERNKKGFFWFSNTHFKSMEFDIRIQAGSASPFSKSLITTQMDRMLELGVIDGEEYLENIPTDILPKAEQIIHRREEKIKKQQEQEEQIKSALVTQAVNEVITQAQANDIPLNQEVLNHLFNIVDQIASTQEGGEEGQAQQQPQAQAQRPPQAPQGPQEGMPR